MIAGATPVATMPRVHVDNAGNRAYVVDYRHVIHSLRCKAMAFAGPVYREQLFPRETYRRTYHALCENGSESIACKTLVELLTIAHEGKSETALAEVLEQLLDAGTAPNVAALQERFTPRRELPRVRVVLPTLAGYDALLTVTQNVDNTVIEHVAESA